MHAQVEAIAVARAAEARLLERVRIAEAARVATEAELASLRSESAAKKAEHERCAGAHGCGQHSGLASGADYTL